MTNDIVNVLPPPVMDISSFSNIHIKLKHLTSQMRSKAEVDSQLVDIECFSIKEDEGNRSVVRFTSTTKADAWFEIAPLKKYDAIML